MSRLRPTVRRLPDKVGCSDRQPKDPSDEEPSRAHDITAPRADETAEERDAEQHDEVLVQHRCARDRSDRDPQAGVAGSQEPGGEPEDHHPGGQVEGWRAEKVGGAEHEAAGGDDGARTDLRRSPAAKLACEYRSNDDRGGDRHRRQQTESGEVPGRDRIGDPCDERDEGRHVDVAPREVPSGFEEVQLVAVPPIAPRHHDLDTHERKGDGHHVARRERLESIVD